MARRTTPMADFSIYLGIFVIMFLRVASAYEAMGKWSPGRATFYGFDDGHGGSVLSKDTGSCGYGKINRGSMPWGYVAAPVRASSLNLYSGRCGSCIEVTCTGSPDLGHSDPCFGGQSVVVQVTDSCPCYQANNEQSNKRWCCGDMPHFDLSTEAFRTLAPLWTGVIYVRFRPVSCDFINGIVVHVDQESTAYWLGVRFLYIGNSGALSQVEGKTAGGTWVAMSKGWGATWVMQHYRAMRMPISLRITTHLTSRKLTFVDVISSIEPRRDVMTNVQFRVLNGPGSYRRLQQMQFTNGTDLSGCTPIMIAEDDPLLDASFNCGNATLSSSPANLTDADSVSSSPGSLAPMAGPHRSAVYFIPELGIPQSYYDALAASNEMASGIVGGSDSGDSRG